VMLRNSLLLTVRPEFRPEIALLAPPTVPPGRVELCNRLSLGFGAVA
jgi:hypothetical protein